MIRYQSPRQLSLADFDWPFQTALDEAVSLTGEGVARVDHLRWDALNEGGDLKSPVDAYWERQGVYPELILGDTIYSHRENRRYLKDRGIRVAGKPLDRPKKVTEDNREELKRLAAQRREEYLQRIPIKGNFGQGKTGYRLNCIRAKRADTSTACINSIFQVMNLLVLLKVFCWLASRVSPRVRYWPYQVMEKRAAYWRARAKSAFNLMPDTEVAATL